MPSKRDERLARLAPCVRAPCRPSTSARVRDGPLAGAVALAAPTADEHRPVLQRRGRRGRSADRRGAARQPNPPVPTPRRLRHRGGGRRGAARGGARVELACALTAGCAPAERAPLSAFASAPAHPLFLPRPPPLARDCTSPRYAPPHRTPHAACRTPHAAHRTPHTAHRTLHRTAPHRTAPCRTAQQPRCRTAPHT
eukprot:4731531-Prymnesium_polylepis.2